MEKQQFLDKFEELKSPANAQRWALLQLWLVEAKSDGEIAKALGKDRSTATRKIIEICKHFGTDAKGNKEQRQHLVLLFRKYCLDFEVHSSIYPDWVDGDLSDRPQPPTNPQNIPTPELISELTTLEFIGRDRDLTNLANLSRQAKIVLIKAGAGVGKSTLAKEFLKMHFHKVIEINLALSVDENVPASERLPVILKELNQEISNSFALNLDCLKKRLLDRNQPSVAFLIDNLEPALDNNFRFVEKLNNYEALLGVLGDRDVCSFTLITSRRSLITPRAKVHEYSLEGLDITAWRQYFHDCENGTDSEALVQMRNAYNGNAKVMDILYGAIKNRFDGNIGVYWNRYKDVLLADSELETLISVEMDWLRDHQPDAYKLLCRMGCYRYQDVKTVPFDGLICLLWDLPESKRVGVVDYLSKTSLIEVKGEYYLHPAIREVTKSYLLKDKLEWETTNHEVGDFWLSSAGCNIKEIKSYNEAVRVIESLEHFYTIENWEKIFSIWKDAWRLRSFGYASILNNYEERLRSSLTFSDLEKLENARARGINLYFLSKYSEAIKFLSLDSRIFQGNILLREIIRIRWLCACYVDIGNFKLVIEYENYAVEAGKQLEYNDSQVHLLNLLGVSYCNLCNYEIALTKHCLALDIAKKTCDQSHVAYSMAYLAYCKFSQIEFHGDFQKSETTEIANILDKAIEIFREYGDKSSEVIAKCYLVRLNLYEEKINLAQEFYKSAYDVNQELSQTASFSSPYLKNILLSTLAKLKFMAGKFHETLDLLRQSITLCEEIGTNFFLAESYLQLGLTYQAMREHDQAEEYKTKALELFAQMEAPKQIERVNKAFKAFAQLMF